MWGNTVHSAVCIVTIKVPENECWTHRKCEEQQWLPSNHRYDQGTRNNFILWQMCFFFSSLLLFAMSSSDITLFSVKQLQLKTRAQFLQVLVASHRLINREDKTETVTRGLAGQCPVATVLKVPIPPCQVVCYSVGITEALFEHCTSVSLFGMDQTISWSWLKGALSQRFNPPLITPIKWNLFHRTAGIIRL